MEKHKDLNLSPFEEDGTIRLIDIDFIRRGDIPMVMQVGNRNTKDKFFKRFFCDIEDHADWIVVFPELNNPKVDHFVGMHSWAKKDENTDVIQAVNIKGYQC